MYKTLIWGLGYTYNVMKNTVAYFEYTSQIEVVAIVSNDIYLQKLDGYNVINPCDIWRFQWDFIVVMSDINFNQIVEEAVNQYSIERDRMIPYRVLQIPNLSFDKYYQLKKSRISIVSNNCWGGIIYRTLGLECLSPFKNLFLKDEDYLKMIQDIKSYMSIEPIGKRCETDPHSAKVYPVLEIGDIEIHCNHAENFEMAINDWNRRKSKINYSNLYVEMYTMNPLVAEKFVEKTIGYKGICFVPWKTTEKKLLTLEMPSKHKEFWETVNANASMNAYGLKYSLVDLLNGEIVLRY